MKQNWIYKARDPLGKPISGEIEGDYEQVRQAIADKGLIPTKIKRRPEKISLSSITGNFGSANREHLIIFTRKLKTLYIAGVPLLRALSVIERGAKELDMVEEIRGIKSDLQSGIALSQALARFPKKFPSIYVSSVAAGEASGSLDEVLGQLAILVEKEMILSRMVKSAIRYPLMVITAITLAIFVLLTFVVPRFADIYGKFGADLPLPTRLLIGTGNFFSAYWYLILILIILGIIGLRKYIATENGRLRWDLIILKIPLMGDMVVKANIARFSSMLNILFRSGVTMVDCLNILQETSSNKVIGQEIKKMADSFEQGREIGSVEDDYRFIPSMALEMLEVGLESGSVETVMKELAEHYEMELEYKSRHLAAMLEPILTVVIGAMILVLALAIFLPMWSLIKVFQ